MKIYTLDFETYYDREYSLSKMTTEEYIRGDLFEVIGVSVQENDNEPVWFSGTLHETKKFLLGFDFSNNLALAHNAVFDAAILSWHFGIQPRGWLDTLSMARAIHGTEVGGSLATLAEHYDAGVKGNEVVSALGKRRIDFTPAELAGYGEYCKNDTALTYKLFQYLSVDFPKTELRLIDLTIRMFSEPVLHLNWGLLKAHLAAIKANKDALMRELLHQGYTQEVLMSNLKFAELLKAEGVLPPTKISPTTGKETYAFSKTDEEFKALLEHENAIVQALVAARLGVKSTLEEARTERFIGISQRGPMPVPLRYYAAHTGRWGDDNKLNLQNLPRESRIKDAIVAPADYYVIDCDSSQIEARTLAWIAEQEDLVEAFANGDDVYVMMASAIYNKDRGGIIKSERFVGKQTVLGAGYGMGHKKFQKQLKNFQVELEESECKRIITVYRDTYPQITKLWQTAHSILDAIIEDKYTEFGRDGLLKVEGRKGIRLPNGLYLKYPNLRRREDPETGKIEYVYDAKKGKTTVANRIYGGKVVENVCQALARIIIGLQMLMIAKKYRVVLTVHDAIACLAPKEEIERAVEFVELCMRIRPPWGPDLPLNCESGYGTSYGDC